MIDLKAYLANRKTLIEAALEKFLLPTTTWPTSLHQAMRYSMMAGGKRLRPILVLAGCEAVAGDIEVAIPTACAMEMIHTYSLIHDDLPAMDDDDLRRGHPTNHKVYGEAIAILAGDSLLTEAFSMIAKTPIPSTHTAQLLKVIALIADAAGSGGMAGGQVVDLESEHKKISAEELKKIHVHKTGKLIQASVTAGAMLGKGSEAQINNLGHYGMNIGLAFQIADDILDIEGGEAIGKDVGSDLAKEKSTYPSVLGMETSRKLAHDLIEEALGNLQGFSAHADPLRAIAQYVISRKN